MTWFKVDDNYWSHPKVMFQSLEASGLWVRAASWTANHLTDGRIPIKVAHMIIPKRPRSIDALGDELETLGMWIREDDCWVFHDWDRYQPTREKVEAERDEARQRMARVRANKRRTFGSGSATPSRPDPTRPDLSTGGGPSGPAATSTTEAEPPCEHGSAEPRLCALCRRAQKEQANAR